ETPGNQYKVEKALKSLNASPDLYTNYEWLHTKGILNKKKDIMWWLAHQALPLGYRLLHISQNNLGNCPNCIHTTQTLEHFALKYPLSKIIWETAYKFLKYAAEPIPSTIENIFQATNITSTHKRKTAIWIHITAIYEI
ncbi:19904_t:CDS:1, partial [Cetraspora pellucida]